MTDKLQSSPAIKGRNNDLAKHALANVMCNDLPDVVLSLVDKHGKLKLEMALRIALEALKK